MSILLTILTVIIIFSLLVLIHEAGHFFAARRAGIRVLEFGVGFPPRLFGKKKGSTIYSINAIPFGGFVRLHGEDSSDVRVLKAKDSYAGKSPWTRTKVVAAGVFMNLLLAIVLLTIGFSFGIEPLITSGDDVISYIQDGTVQTQPGAFIEKVTPEQAALGLEALDKLLAINDKPVRFSSDLAVFQKGKAEKDLDLVVLKKNNEQKKIHLPLVGNKNDFNLQLKPSLQLPRLKVLEVKPFGAMQRAGVRPEDVILAVNGKEIFTSDEFYAGLENGPENALVNFLRDSGEIFSANISLADTRRLIITSVLPDSPALKAGIGIGDIVRSINSEQVAAPDDVVNIIKKNPSTASRINILRAGNTLEFDVIPNKGGQIGIGISAIHSFRNAELSIYQTGILTSIMKVLHVSYDPLTALKKSVGESVKLMSLTARGFLGAIASIIGSFSVPGDIGGPVQIAIYTSTFMKEGFLALLRFTALLSLSLAVINVLPIPALDGGRLLFIVIEVVFKKRVNARLEAMVHSIGFALLLGLIGIITYSDISKLF